MPQHKSAKKRVRTSTKAQAQNRAARSTLRGAIKRLRAERDKNPDEAARELQSVLDRAVGSGLIHQNKAARLKSRFRGSK